MVIRNLRGQKHKKNPSMTKRSSPQNLILATDDSNYPISLCSRNLAETQHMYGIREQVMHSILESLHEFQSMLLGF
jgi:hypothetical protein